MRIHDWFEYHATARPELPFLRMRGRSMSYAEVERSANRQANALIAHELEVGDRLGWPSTNSLKWARCSWPRPKPALRPSC